MVGPLNARLTRAAPMSRPECQTTSGQQQKWDVAVDALIRHDNDTRLGYFDILYLIYEFIIRIIPSYI